MFYQSSKRSGCCITTCITTSISRGEEAFFVKNDCMENISKLTYQWALEAVFIWLNSSIWFIWLNSSTSLYALCLSIKLLGSSGPDTLPDKGLSIWLAICHLWTVLSKKNMSHSKRGNFSV